MSQNIRNQDFSYYFCIMIEGSRAGSTPLTNRSGSGRPKNILLSTTDCYSSCWQDLYLEKVNKGEDTFTEQGLAAILREIFVIGSESESVMLRWALRILSCHPTVQEAVQAELDKVP
jgi:hypothetical protein